MHVYPTDTVIAGRYRVVRVLGRGGFGVTYEAIDLASADAQRVALKELRLDVVDRWAAVARFEREARVLSGIHHPKVPRVLDVITPSPSADEDPSGVAAFILVQELAPGVSLAGRVAAGWRPDEPALRALARAVLEVLVYLHSLSPPVLHRDITPGNLVSGEDPTQVMLVDFGAVRGSLASESRPSSVVGTWGYMAPEQLQGIASPASDLYGLGATLAFVATGRSPADLPRTRLRLDLAGLSGMSPELARWLRRLMEPVPEDRFPSAAAALQALDAGATAGAMRPVGPVRMAIRERVPPGAGVMAIPAALSLVAATYLALRGALRRPGPILLGLAALGVVAFGALAWPLVQGLFGRSVLTLDGTRWTLERRVAGLSWRTVAGHVEDLTGCDASVQTGAAGWRRTGVALTTRGRAHLVASHLDAPQRAAIAAAVRGYLSDRVPPPESPPPPYLGPTLVK